MAASVSVVLVAHIRLTDIKISTVVNKVVASLKHTGEDGIYSQYEHWTKTEYIITHYKVDTSE